MKLKKLLVPTDFSNNARNALSFAIGIAQKSDAEILLFHVYQPVLVNTDFAQNRMTFDIQETEKVAEEKLEKLIAAAVKSCPGVKINYALSKGSGVKEVIKAVNEHKSDMIIMGTKGAGAVESLFLGSFAAETLEKAPCPVMAIPGKAQYKDFENIAFASELDEKDSRLLSQITDFARLFHSKLNIFHFGEKDEKMKNFEKETRSSNSYENLSFSLLPGKNIVEAIGEHIQKQGSDLLVMVTRKRTFVEKLYDRSITKRVAYQTEIPLLTFQAK